MNSTSPTTAYDIAAFSSNPGSSYNIQVVVDIPNLPTLRASNLISYKIQVTPLLIYINGGNRMQSYSAPLIVDGVAIDPDVVPSDQALNISLTWDCINMNTNAACKNIQGEKIELGPSNKLSYPAKV